MPRESLSRSVAQRQVAKSRARAQQKKALSLPGSTEYLYAGETPSTHGRQPGTLQNLALSRERKTREVLAELGIKPEDAAVTLRAAKEALLRVMPDILPFALFVLVLFVFALSHIEKQAALSYRLISAILATLMLLLAF